MGKKERKNEIILIFMDDQSKSIGLEITSSRIEKNLGRKNPKRLKKKLTKILRIFEQTKQCEYSEG